ncbi:MAG: YkgJ family cysteine cluster protein [Bacteriovorax sp.]|nr:YkgJ family cysteine cluster protein [Bacteriovorax sp.]
MSKKNTPGKIEEHLKDFSRWTLYKKGMCDSCEGLCCYMPVEVKTSDLIRLGILAEFHLEMTLKEQIKDALKHPGVQRYTASTEKFTLTQKSDSTCFFLDSNKRCTQYDIRPDTCRNHPKVGPRPDFCAYMKKE